MIEKEVWKTITDYPDYEVSNKGSVRSYKNNYRVIMRGFKCRKGYPKVYLTNYGTKGKSIFAHRLVALEFIDNPHNYPQVNHINGIKTDNRVENLEWCDNTHNQREAWRLGLIKNETRQGANNGMTKLTVEQVLEIRELYPKLSQNELSRKFSIAQSQIWAIVNRKTWFYI